MTALKMIKGDGPKAMTVGELHSHLGKLILEGKSHFPVEILTETKKHGQIQQPLGSINVSTKEYVILVPPGF